MGENREHMWNRTEYAEEYESPERVIGELRTNEIFQDIQSGALREECMSWSQRR